MLLKKAKLAVASIVFSSTLLFSNTVFAQKNMNINVNRISGSDRYETCCKIVSSAWSKTDTAVLVNGEMYADAIVSTPLARKFNAPILLTESNNLTQVTNQELKNLKVKEIYIVGGTGVISSNVENNLKSQGYNVTRIAGQDRYNTSIQVSKQLLGSSEMFVVDGDSWKEAVSIAPIAANQQSPILLANKDNVINSIKAYAIYSMRPITVVGDNSFVKSNGVINSFGTFSTVSGNDSIDINKSVIEKYKDKLNLGGLYLTSDSTFADALSCSAVATMHDNPIILTNSKNQDNVKSIIHENRNVVSDISVLGGTALISDDIINNIVDEDSFKDNNFTNNDSINSFYNFIGDDKYVSKIKKFVSSVQNDIDLINVSNLDNNTNIKQMMLIKHNYGKMIDDSKIIIVYDKSDNCIKFAFENQDGFSKNMKDNIWKQGFSILSNNNNYTAQMTSDIYKVDCILNDIYEGNNSEIHKSIKDKTSKVYGANDVTIVSSIYGSYEYELYTKSGFMYNLTAIKCPISK